MQTGSSNTRHTLNCGLQNIPALFQHLTNIQQYLSICDNVRNYNIQQTQRDQSIDVGIAPKENALTLLVRGMSQGYTKGV